MFASIAEWVQCQYMRELDLVAVLGTFAKISSYKLRLYAADSFLMLSGRSYDHREMDIVETLGWTVPEATRAVIDESLSFCDADFYHSLKRLCQACAHLVTSHSDNIMYWELNSSDERRRQVLRLCLDVLVKMLHHPSPRIISIALTALDTVLSRDVTKSSKAASVRSSLESIVSGTVRSMTRHVSMVLQSSSLPFSKFVHGTQVNLASILSDPITKKYLEREFDSPDDYIPYHTQNRAKAGALCKVLADISPELVSKAIVHITKSCFDRNSLLLSTGKPLSSHIEENDVGNYTDGSCSRASPRYLELRGTTTSVNHLIGGISQRIRCGNRVLPTDHHPESYTGKLDMELVSRISGDIMDAAESLLSPIQELSSNPWKYDPLLLSVWCQFASTFGAWFGAMNDSRVANELPQVYKSCTDFVIRVAQTLFAIAETPCPSSVPLEMENGVPSFRFTNESYRQRRACLSLVHYGRFTPTFLVGVIQDICSKVAQLTGSEKNILPPAEEIILYEFVVLIANVTDATSRTNLVSQVSVKPLEWWTSATCTSCFDSCASLLSSIGLIDDASTPAVSTSKPWEKSQEMVSNLSALPPCPPSFPRDRLLDTLGYLWSIRRRCIQLQQGNKSVEATTFSKHWNMLLPSICQALQISGSVWDNRNAEGRQLVCMNSWSMWILAVSREEIRLLIGQEAGSLLDLGDSEDSGALEATVDDGEGGSYIPIRSTYEPQKANSISQLHYRANGIAVWWLRIYWHLCAILAMAAQDGRDGLFKKADNGQSWFQVCIQTLQKTTYMSNNFTTSIFPARVQCNLFRQLIIPLVKNCPSSDRLETFESLTPIITAAVNTVLQLFSKEVSSLSMEDLYADVGLILPGLEDQERDIQEIVRHKAATDLARCLIDLGMIEAPALAPPLGASDDVQQCISTASLRYNLLFNHTNISEPLIQLFLAVVSADYGTEGGSETAALQSSNANYSEHLKKRSLNLWTSFLAILSDLSALYFFERSSSELYQTILFGTRVLSERLFGPLMEALLLQKKWTRGLEHDAYPLACDVYCLVVLGMLSPPVDQSKPKSAHGEKASFGSVYSSTDLPGAERARLNVLPEQLSLVPRTTLSSLKYVSADDISRLEDNLKTTGPSAVRPNEVKEDGTEAGKDFGSVKKRRKVFRDFCRTISKKIANSSGSQSSLFLEGRKSRVENIAEELFINKPDKVEQDNPGSCTLFDED